MPPARVWSTLDARQQLDDALVRRPSEAGFTSAAKRRFGLKLRDNVLECVVEVGEWASGEPGHARTEA